MNLNYQQLLPEEFSNNSRVWIYQSNRLFTLGEALDIETAINNFCEDWQSHGADVKAFGNLFFGQFIVLMADETAAAVSGCSTDSSVRFIKTLGAQYNVDFFNRTNLAFIVKGKVEILPLNQLTYAFQNNFINGETIYFNNTITNKEQLLNNWLIPVQRSWLAPKFNTALHQNSGL